MPKRKSEATETETVVLTKKKVRVMASSKDSYTPQQKSCIAEFTSFTSADRSTAAKVLKQHNWNTQAAVTSFFSNPNGGSSNPLRSSLTKTFDKYRDNPSETPDEIGMEGTQKLAEDLGIELDKPSAFVLFEIVQSPSLGTVTREGFVEGWSEAGADTIPKMRNVVLQRQSQLQTDTSILKEVYNHSFQLMLQEKQKALLPEVAMEFWTVLLKSPSWEWRTQSTPWLDWWMEFYQETRSKKAVNKDLWKQTLNFALETVKDDSMSFWSEESSWPSVIDEFVEWVREKRKGGDAMDTAA